MPRRAAPAGGTPAVSAWHGRGTHVVPSEHQKSRPLSAVGFPSNMALRSRMVKPLAPAALPLVRSPWTSTTRRRTCTSKKKGVMIDRMMSNVTVTMPDIMADMVRRLPCVRLAARIRGTPCVVRQSAHCTEGRVRQHARKSSMCKYLRCRRWCRSSTAVPCIGSSARVAVVVRRALYCRGTYRMHPDDSSPVRIVCLLA